MPVACGVELDVVGQEEFHAVDRVVMREAFAIHNTLGRFCDEAVYQEALARRCRIAGLDVQREVPVRVRQRDFVKPYYLDLLVAHGVVYELKTVRALNATSHHKQVINYLLLTGLRHGKLLNFRPTSVESRYVSTRLGREDRADPKWIDDEWDGNDHTGRGLRGVLGALIEDWGTFLDVALYQDALDHLLSGHESCAQEVDIFDSGHVIGQQRMFLLDAMTAWHLSTVGQNLRGYEVHLQRLLRHTRLARLHWINLHHNTITLKTLSNSHDFSLPEE